MSKNVMLRALSVFLSVSLLNIGFESKSARAQSRNELSSKATTEGALAFYVGGPTAPWEARAKIFEQRYPGIKVSVVGGFSNVLDKGVDQQFRDNKLEVDATIFQTLQDFVRWKDEGHLLNYKPDGFDRIDASFKDPDGAYYGIQVIAVPYMYNTQHVSAADVPNSALDFLNEKFRGKIVTPYPADDDVTLWLFYKAVQKYGWNYMDKYMRTSLTSSRVTSGRNVASPLARTGLRLTPFSISRSR